MNTALVFQILQLALSLAQSHLSGTAKQDILVGQTLVDLVEKGTEAYQQHMDQPVDTASIKAEEAI
jgi:hypothetical protein